MYVLGQLQLIHGQLQLPIYADYLTDNYFLVHPAMAGAQLEGVQARMTHRSQWQGVANAPSLQTINAHGRIGLKSGLGTVFYTDRNGFQNQVGASVTYAHHINLIVGNRDIHQLSFGLSAGVLNNTHDQTQFDIKLGDPLVEGSQVKSNGLHMDLGLTYIRYQFYTHFTVRNLIFKGQNISDDISLDKAKKIIVNTGHFFELSENAALEPSVMIQIVDYADLPSFDMNMKSHHTLNNLNFSFGASYRFGTQPNTNLFSGENLNQDHKQLTLLTGLQFRGVSFFYTYTHSFEDIQIAPFNSHQFTLGFDLSSDKFRFFPVRGML
jgi:type IX secretion system PorP/SprF family membrane protein|tara:strand:- start:188 stop:1156 length:969 start_codon:yes stop_codon:yes gene_type:complete